jgi:hypothetical protein
MTDLRIGTLLFIGGAVSIMSFGCELIASVDRSAIPPPKQYVTITNESTSSGTGGIGGMGMGGSGGSGGIVQAGSGGMGGMGGPGGSGGSGGSGEMGGSDAGM